MQSVTAGTLFPTSLLLLLPLNEMVNKLIHFVMIGETDLWGILSINGPLEEKLKIRWWHFKTLKHNSTNIVDKGECINCIRYNQFNVWL